MAWSSMMAIRIMVAASPRGARFSPAGKFRGSGQTMSFLSRFRGQGDRLPAGGAGGAGDARDQRGVVPGRDLVARPARRARRRSQQAERPRQVAARRRDRPARLSADRPARVPSPLRARRRRRRAACSPGWTRTTPRTRKAAPTMAEVATRDRGQARASWRPRSSCTTDGAEKAGASWCCPTSAARRWSTCASSASSSSSANRPRSRSAGSSVYQTLWLNRIGVSAMAAVSLLALFMYLRQTATLDRTLAERGRADRRRARPARAGGRRAHGAAAASSPSTCRRSARTSAAASRASCTTSSAPSSPPPSSTSRASSRASARRPAPTPPSASPT